jgi:hypothetical protein
MAVDDFVLFQQRGSKNLPKQPKLEIGNSKPETANPKPQTRNCLIN